ncbi:flagellar basal body-associated FliL family protein [Thermogutta sp.]|jgi:flagellar FliL protein|uniref:flagellar basal body-associated FliL family protein n=1 Tax=Thermogutta sp. TaxID=1962930 RepID=UPI00321FB566
MAGVTENAGKKEQTDQQTATPSRHHGGLRLKLAGFIVGLVTVEALAAYFILPGSTNAGPPSHETEKMAVGTETATPAAPVSVPETQVDPTQGLGTPGTGTEVEVDLGEFSVTSYQPATQTTLRIDFHLWGTVDQSQEKDFQAAWAKANNRVRDQILVIVRSAELTDLTDAGLGLIKRKILEKVNHALGKPYLKSVVFSEFSFLEQ